MDSFGRLNKWHAFAPFYNKTCFAVQWWGCVWGNRTRLGRRTHFCVLHIYHIKVYEIESLEITGFYDAQMTRVVVPSAFVFDLLKRDFHSNVVTSSYHKVTKRLSPLRLWIRVEPIAIGKCTLLQINSLFQYEVNVSKLTSDKISCFRSFDSRIDFVSVKFTNCVLFQIPSV